MSKCNSCSLVLFHALLGACSELVSVRGLKYKELNIRRSQGDSTSTIYTNKILLTVYIVLFFGEGGSDKPASAPRLHPCLLSVYSIFLFLFKLDVLAIEFASFGYFNPQHLIFGPFSHAYLIDHSIKFDPLTSITYYCEMLCF